MKKKSKKKTTAGKLLSKSKQRKGRQVHYLFVTVIALLLLIDLPFFMFAGNVRDSIPDYPVKGKMIDEKGKPLPGADEVKDYLTENEIKVRPYSTIEKDLKDFTGKLL